MLSAEGKETPILESVQTIMGPDPKCAIGIFVKDEYAIVRQPIGSRELSDGT